MSIDKLNLRGIKSLPSGGEAFLEELMQALELEKVRCIQVFGTAVTGEISDVSDLDLRIVLKDGYAEDRAELRRQVKELAERNLETYSESRNRFEKWIDNQTGMFESGMITTETAVLEGKYYHIGDVSRLSFISPWRIVLVKVFDGAVTIYGDHIEPKWENIGRPEDMKFRELFKSFIITFALSSAQWIYSLFSDRATLYSMEAYKWTVFNCAFVITEEINTLEESSDICNDSGEVGERFWDLREEFEPDYSFIFKAPWAVTAIHINSFLRIIGS